MIEYFIFQWSIWRILLNNQQGKDGKERQGHLFLFSAPLYNWISLANRKNEKYIFPWVPTSCCVLGQKKDIFCVLINFPFFPVAVLHEVSHCWPQKNAFQGSITECWITNVLFEWAKYIWTTTIYDQRKYVCIYVPMQAFKQPKCILIFD